jgi:hypothetical protein
MSCLQVVCRCQDLWATCCLAVVVACRDSELSGPCCRVAEMVCFQDLSASRFLGAEAERFGEI